MTKGHQTWLVTALVVVLLAASLIVDDPELARLLRAALLRALVGVAGAVGLPVS